MPHRPLATYLNDHLAGSLVAIRLLESIEAVYGAHDDTLAIALEVSQVRREIEAERDLLEQLIARVGSGESTMRKTAGWFAERFAKAKMAADDGGDGTFRVFEMTEVVVLGILGKGGLWRTLRANLDRVPEARDLDLDGLAAQAYSQFERMETVRLAAARLALTP